MTKRKAVFASCILLGLLSFSCNEPDPNVRSEYHPNGKLKFIKRYKNEILEGQSQWFYPNGKIEQTVIFKNGKENGPAYYFYESGSLKSFRNWRKGNMHGYANDFFDSTVWVVKAVLYFNNNGSLINRREYSPNGQIINQEGNFK